MKLTKLHSLTLCTYLYFGMNFFLITCCCTVLSFKLNKGHLHAISCVCLQMPTTTGLAGSWQKKKDIHKKNGFQGHWTLTWVSRHSSQPLMYHFALTTYGLVILAGAEYIFWRRVERAVSVSVAVRKPLFILQEDFPMQLPLNHLCSFP